MEELPVPDSDPHRRGRWCDRGTHHGRKRHGFEAVWDRVHQHDVHPGGSHGVLFNRICRCEHELCYPPRAHHGVHDGGVHCNRDCRFERHATGIGVFRPLDNVQVSMDEMPEEQEELSIGDQIVGAFTVEDFSDVISTKHMLPLIVFAVLVGLSANLVKDKGAVFRSFLDSGNEVFMKMTGLIMYYAPIGLGAYFAALIGELGSQLVGGYVRAFAVYYPVAIVYFFAAFTLYSWLAGGVAGMRRMWANILAPTAVSLGTGSSVASIPSNLRAAKRIGVPDDIRETIIPIGATIHMEGSCLSAILKIAFLFAVFERDIFTPQALAIAVLIALLSGMVMSGIPSGGFLGELMIVSMYGFPPAALPIISVIGTLVDPPATTINAAGDTVSSMMVARAVDGKDWMKKETQTSDGADLGESA